MTRGLIVWVDGWQMQCCGDPFRIGSSVEWTLYDESDRDWLTAVLGAEIADTVTHGEEHHGGLPDDAPATRGTVTRIRAVSSSFGADPSTPNVLTPTPGTGVVTDIENADGWYPENEVVRFNGYLVNLDVE